MHLIAARAFVYAGRPLGAGEVFDAKTAEDARILTTVRLAYPMPSDDTPEPAFDEPVKRPRGRPRKVS